MKRSGLTFIEIMIAVLIMATALISIFKFFAHTTGMSKKERTQAAAAAYCAKIMNQYMYELQWSNLADGSIDGSGMLDNDSSTGVEFQWSGKVLDAWPVGQNFAVQRTVYHDPCGGPCSGGLEDLPRSSPQEINPNFVSRVGTVFKTLVLTFKWKGPGDNGWDDVRTMTLVGRRGMLEEANQ